jgi:A/G-specific adenine glycosylase
VLVSELMLQQTQVSRVVPRFLSFMDRFPTVAECARAPVGDLIRAWSGLGYNRRAVNLHRAATVVVADHGSRLPADLAGLGSLPGVGPYTARAIMAFAFDADVGIVESNSARVLARAVSGHALTTREAQAAADRLVPGGSGWAWNQAMLDLGAMVCTRRNPSCGRCPLRDVCTWAQAGWPEPDPCLGTAGAATGQSAFAGSDRQGRGRLIDALRRGPVRTEQLAVATGWPDQHARAQRVAATLVADGLARLDDGLLSLP